MKVRPNPFKKAIEASERQVGLWISLANNFAAEVIAPAGYDWALVDMEHSPNDYFSVLGQLQAFAAYDTTAIVRVEWNDAVAVKRLLDLGAPGLMFPMIQTVEEAEAAVASTRYPPNGIRGVAGSSRATMFGRIPDYVSRVEDETAILLQLETREAVKRASEIGAVDGVDGVFFGPGDIAADLGKVGSPMDSEVWELIKPAAKALIAQGVPVGTLVLDPAFAASLFDEGFSFVACGTDTALLAKSADMLLAQVKGA